MKPQRILYLVAGVVLLTATIYTYSCGPKEPVHQGKALNQWIENAYDVGIFEQTDATKAAMTAIGTNGVPFLVKEFTRPISRWRGRLRAWVNAHAFSKIHLRTDEERVRRAGEGLMLLGTNAAPALPVLSRYRNDPERGRFVAEIFHSLGYVPCPAAPLGSNGR